MAFTNASVAVASGHPGQVACVQKESPVQLEVLTIVIETIFRI